MKHAGLYGIYFLSIISLLSACAPFSPTKDKRAGICNQLNSMMIFSGSTGNDRNAEIQNAADPLTQRTYDKTCDQPSS